MKKNISINISGIIFHIEEDGYEVLKKYLDSINKYFSSFEDSSEILPDIESRIAEIFLSKLNEGKQVITKDDVSSLMSTMGSVRDFQAAEEQEFAETKSERSDSRSSSSSSSSGSTSSSSYGAYEPKTFARDQKRKILGGVCAGLANYWNIDAVWVRLLFALFTFAYGLTLIAYVILWIVMPGSYELEEPEDTKKLFRDSENKVLGGVASGLSAYFAIDIVIVRILFVIFTVFGGLGLIAYVVLWIVVPEARSITDRMQMQGEPVTLSNIETNIKKNLDVKEGEEESAFVKIILFPFRLIGFILRGLGKVLLPVAELLRVAVGIFITLIGVTFVLSAIIAGGVLFGLLAMSSGWILGWEEISFPIEALSRTIPTFTAVVGFIAALIPGVVILLLGISVIARKIVFNATVGWSIFIAFFFCCAALSFSVPQIVYGFKEDGEYKVETLYDLHGKTAILRLRETGMDDYNGASLSLKGYDGKELKLVQYFQSQGPSRAMAGEYAQMVDYHVDQQDSIMTFDSNIQFKEDAIFKGQRLRMTLYVPYNYPFVLDDEFWRLLSTYIRWEKREGNTWIFNDEGSMECVSCEPDRVSTNSGEEVVNEYGYEDFDELIINGLVDVNIYRGREYAVELTGDQREKERYRVVQRGDALVIEYRNERRFIWEDRFFNLEKMRINIVLPSLERLEINGAGDVDVTDFRSDDLEIEASGAVKINADLSATRLNVELNGASELELTGSGRTLEANLLGASTLRAYRYEVSDAVIEAVAACRAFVNVTDQLDIRSGFGSKVEYIGNPERVTRD